MVGTTIHNLPKVDRPRTLLGPLSAEALATITEALGEGVSDVAAFYFTHTATHDDAPTHVIIATYEDSEGHTHYVIGVEVPDNGHSKVLADVVIP